MFCVFCGQKNENVYASLCIGMIRGAVGLQRVEGRAWYASGRTEALDEQEATDTSEDSDGKQKV